VGENTRTPVESDENKCIVAEKEKQKLQLNEELHERDY
jgi:hypothetical protein